MKKKLKIWEIIRNVLEWWEEKRSEKICDYFRILKEKIMKLKINLRKICRIMKYKNKNIL